MGVVRVFYRAKSGPNPRPSWYGPSRLGFVRRLGGGHPSDVVGVDESDPSRSASGASR